MAWPFRNGRFAVVLTLAMALMVTIAGPAPAQQPSSVNPTASAVQEQQLLDRLQAVQGRITIPDDKAATLIQPAGRDWRQFHEVTLKWVGAVSILGMLLLLVGFYLTRGMVKIEGGRSGRSITRFNGFERFMHWMTATCFIILAISGLNITFGKSLLLPIMGAEAFTAWSQWGKYAHNYLSFPFTIGVVLILLTWLGHNIPNARDFEWLRRGGGLVGRDHPPAGYFNAGQKAIYWIVVLAGTAVAITGYLLMFPFYATDIAGMQTAQTVHAVVAVLFVAVMLAHIYIGTVGMEGAFDAMGSGEVDVNWARQHHSLWARKIEEQERHAAPAPQGRGMAPAE
jgi:formate dehydrogenase subunit gamma